MPKLESPRQMMKLYLTEFEEDAVFGIYGADENKLAARMRFLHPDAAKAFRAMNHAFTIRCSDMLRTPDGSLRNRRRKGRGLRPGWSGHNYGFSIDIDVGWMLNHHKVDKITLDEEMFNFGWYCHNIPGETRSYEAWHYNYFGPEGEHYLSFRDDTKTRTWSKPVANKIEEYYGHWWQRADEVTVQMALASLGLYGGDFDGDLGELTTTSIESFQKAWDLSVDGVAGPTTKRTLMLVSADRVLVDEAC